MADCPARDLEAGPFADGLFDQIRCSESRQLLADRYRAAVRASEIVRAGTDPSSPEEEEA